MSQSWFCHAAAHMSARNGHILHFFVMLTLTVDTVFCFCVIAAYLDLWTVTGAISFVIVNVYTNGRYTASVNEMKQTCVIIILAYLNWFKPKSHWKHRRNSMFLTLGFSKQISNVITSSQRHSRTQSFRERKPMWNDHCFTCSSCMNRLFVFTVSVCSCFHVSMLFSGRVWTDYLF